MKNGQCPKCGEHNVRSNTNRKFPALNTITLGSGTCDKRYAPLDTYVCGSCGYLESYVAKSEDLSYIQEKWALVQEDRTQEAGGRRQKAPIHFLLRSSLIK